jgi:hypothetical protein
MLSPISRTVAQPRLAQEMKQQTLQHTEQQIERDLGKLKGYLDRAQDHANRQARPLGLCGFFDSSKDVQLFFLRVFI